MAVNVLISWLNYCLNKLYFIILFLVNISGRVVSRLVYLLSAFFVARLRNGLETVPIIPKLSLIMTRSIAFCMGMQRA